PATGFIEVALAAAHAAFQPEPLVLEDLTFERALGVPPGGVELVAMVHEPEGGRAAFEIGTASDERATEWSVHARGTIVLDAGHRFPSEQAPAQLSASLPPGADMTAFYAGMAKGGLGYGPHFRLLTQLQNNQSTALGR